jgi:uncharacterized protein
MSLSVNLRHLETRNLILRGELSLAELDLDVRDEMIRVVSPIEFDLEIEKLDDAILIQGGLRVELECECVRCLKKFAQALDLEDWTLHLPLSGDDAVSVDNDSVDLTPFVREDILLGFPQHPLCKPDCVVFKPKTGKSKKILDKVEPKTSAWTELNKLKL